MDPFVVAILVSKKIDFKPKLIKAIGKDITYLSVEKIQQGDVSILNTYATK